jgi:hypothetical protein
LAIIGSAVGEAQATEELLRRIEQLEKRLAETETSQAAATAKAEAAKSEAASEKKEPPAVEFLKSVDVGGFVDVSYGYNFNSPNVRKGGNALRVFDTDDNSFNFDLLEVYAQRTADNPGDAGFRVDLNFGRIADLIDIDHEFGGDDDFDVEQAYVSYNAPIGNGLLIDFGKFVTLHGAEVIESKDNLNFSRSFLFGFAIPFTHTGLRVKYPFSDKASYSQYVVNGWDNVVDNNAPKTLGGQLGLTPTENASFYFNWMFGAEKENNESDKRALIDLVGAYRVSPSLAFVLNYDFATEDNAALDGGDAEWQGVAGYVDYDLSDKIGFALRGEWFNDHDGARTGTAQDLYEVTLTGEYHWTDHLMNRLEYRHDWSSKDSFLEDDDFDDQQDTVFFNVVYMF